MYKGIFKYQLLALTALFVFVSCGDEQGLNVIDPGLTNKNQELSIVDGGENATLEVMKGENSYFSFKVQNTGANSHISTGEKNGWTLNWSLPAEYDTTYEGVSLYSTYNEPFWKPLNYLLNNREEIVSSVNGAGYREIQAAIWMLLEFTEFDPQSVDVSVLPEDMRSNGDFNFDLGKVQQIVDAANAGGNAFEYTSNATHAVVAVSSEGKEIAVIEDSFYAFELIDLREAYGMVVAWDVNDQGQIAGGNMFVDTDGTSVNMGNMFARSMNNNGAVVGNTGRHAAYWNSTSGLIELSSSNESDRSQANDINDRGDIAGEVEVEHLLYEDEEFGDVYEYDYHSYLWSENSGDQAISSDGWAYGINDAMEVVGLDYTVTNRAYVWSSQSGLESLGSFYGFSSARGHAVNNNSQVVGSILVSTSGESAVYASSESNDHFTRLEKEIKRANLDGVYAHAHILEMMRTASLAQDVHVLSESLNADLSNLESASTRMKGISFQSKAFIWDRNQGMLSLGTLGGDWSTAWDINDSGQVVGYSSIGDGESRAFFWDDENGMVELPTFGGNTLARAISNEGEIVGYSYDDSGNFYPVMWKVSVRQAS